MPDAPPPTYGTPEWFTSVDSHLKQMASPSAFRGRSIGAGLNYTFGTTLPLAVGGYPFAYNFTGRGSNNGGFLQKLGIASESESDRTLGSNYFLPMRNKEGGLMKCGSRSKSGCGGQTAHVYIQGYPSEPMGALPAVFDGLTHMNPSMFFDALKDSLFDVAPTCEKVTLPVGSSLNMCRKAAHGDYTGRNLGFQPDVQSPAQAHAINEECLQGCANASFTEMDNCRRDCNRLWWEESKCVPAAKRTIDLKANQCGRRGNGKRGMTYGVPSGSSKSDDGNPVAYSASSQRQSMKGISSNGVSKPASSDSFTNYRHIKEVPVGASGARVARNLCGSGLVCMYVAMAVSVLVMLLYFVLHMLVRKPRR